MSVGRFQNKIVLVTGSSEGIGFAISERLAQEGATVIISSRKQIKVDEAVNALKDKNLKAVGFVCNVSNKEHRDNLRKFIEKEYGRLDVLVPNAATSLFMGSALDTEESVYDKTFEVNVKSVFMMVKEFINLLYKGKDPNICIVGSMGGYTTSSLLGVYCLTKTALLG